MDADEAKHGDSRQCTCHPDDSPPSPCARRYALRDCRIADVARRIYYAADMVPDEDMPTQLRGLARELEALV